MIQTIRGLRAADEAVWGCLCLRGTQGQKGRGLVPVLQQVIRMTSQGVPTVLVAVNGASQALADMIVGNDIRVLVANSGVDVVAHLFPRGDSYSEPPDLMVLSALLPGYNGLSVLAGVRSLGWPTPILLTWPPLEPWVCDEAVRLGCCGLFEEPISPRELAEAVLLVLNRSPQLRDRPECTRPPQGSAA